jgi:hypothetical protein
VEPVAGVVAPPVPPGGGWVPVEPCPLGAVAPPVPAFAPLAPVAPVGPVLGT